MSLAKGKGTRSLMQPSPLAVLAHPFGKDLQEWEKGVPVDCGPSWARESIALALARVAHPTARTKEAMALVHEDVAYQVDAVFTQVVLWKDICNDPP